MSPPTARSDWGRLSVSMTSRVEFALSEARGRWASARSYDDDIGLQVRSHGVGDREAYRDSESQRSYPSSRDERMLTWRKRLTNAPTAGVASQKRLRSNARRPDVPEIADPAKLAEVIHEISGAKILLAETEQEKTLKCQLQNELATRDSRPSAPKAAGLTPNSNSSITPDGPSPPWERRSSAPKPLPSPRSRPSRRYSRSKFSAAEILCISFDDFACSSPPTADHNDSPLTLHRTRCVFQSESSSTRGD